MAPTRLALAVIGDEIGPSLPEMISFCAENGVRRLDMRTVDGKKREALLQQASKLLMADYGLLPLYFELAVWAMRRDLAYAARADQMTLAQFVTLRPAQR